MKKKYCLLLLLLLSGCVVGRESATSPGSGVVQSQAIAAYERGTVYLGQGRYLLAREQFSESASMAVTQGLYDDAMDGMKRANAVLQNRRQSHE